MVGCIAALAQASAAADKGAVLAAEQTEHCLAMHAARAVLSSSLLLGPAQIMRAATLHSFSQGACNLAIHMLEPTALLYICKDASCYAAGPAVCTSAVGGHKQQHAGLLSSLFAF